MKVVNIFVGPCGGKSTVAAGVFYQMKLLNMNVELVTEYAKDLGYSGFMPRMLDQQPLIFAEQNRRQHILRNHVDFAITDSPILLGIVYGQDHHELSTAWKEYAMDTFRSYDNINIFLRRGPEYSGVGRYHTMDEAIVVDNGILAMFHEHYIDYIPVDIGPNTVKNVLEIVERYT